MKHSIASVLFAISLLSPGLWAQSRDPLALANAAVPPGAQRISYGTDPLQFGEVRVPATKGPHPVAIVIHGGCWLARLGNTDPRAVAMDNMRPLAAALTEAGIATWNIEYRRLGNDGGGWPGTFRDVAAGADFLRTLARDRQLDLTRVIAVGHSAGAHLALWLASRHKLTPASDLYTKDPIRLTGAVSLDGPADLQATIPLQQSICRAPVITDLIGGSPEQQPQRYRDASPIALLPLGVRHVFVTGQMFGSHSAPYAAAVKKAGEAAEVIPFPGAGHFVFIDPESMIWPEVMKSVRQMLAMP